MIQPHRPEAEILTSEFEITADRAHTEKGVIAAEGRVAFRTDAMLIHSDRITYDPARRLGEFRGHVEVAERYYPREAQGGEDATITFTEGGGINTVQGTLHRLYPGNDTPQ